MGVQEHYVSSARTAAVAAWAVSAILLTIGWCVALMRPDLWEVGAMCAASSVALAVVAGTLQVRIYVVKVCALIRRGTGLTSVETGDNVRAFP